MLLRRPCHTMPPPFLIALCAGLLGMARSGMDKAEVAQAVVITSVFVVYLALARYRPALAAPPTQVTIPPAYLGAQLGPVGR